MMMSSSRHEAMCHAGAPQPCISLITTAACTTLTPISRFPCRLTAVKQVAGSKAPAGDLLDALLEGDWDPEEYDKKMAAAFGDDYYEVGVLRLCVSTCVCRVCSVGCQLAVGAGGSGTLRSMTRRWRRLLAMTTMRWGA